MSSASEERIEARSQARGHGLTRADDDSEADTAAEAVPEPADG